MKENLPSQAQWTVKLLQWLLNKNLNLEELITDDDVLAGIVTYFTKKVEVEEAKQSNQSSEVVEELEKELDFVKCRLAGADQQRENEVKTLDERNAELRESVVRLTQKFKNAEKEILESKFSVGKIKAELKKKDEELRDIKRTLKFKNNDIVEIQRKMNEVQQKYIESTKQLETLKIEGKVSSDKQISDMERVTKEWKSERSKLQFMLKERDNALSEARQGQAAATKEIQNIKSELENKVSRLSLLEVEAVKNGIPLVRIGDEPVVGSTVAEAIRSGKLSTNNIDDEDKMEETWSERSMKNRTAKIKEPNSSIDLAEKSDKESFDFSSDTRSSQLSDIEIDHPESEVTDDIFDSKNIGYVGVDFNVDSNTAEPVIKGKFTKSALKKESKLKKQGKGNTKTDGPKPIVVPKAKRAPRQGNLNSRKLNTKKEQRNKKPVNLSGNNKKSETSKETSKEILKNSKNLKSQGNKNAPSVNSTVNSSDKTAPKTSAKSTAKKPATKSAKPAAAKPKAKATGKTVPQTSAKSTAKKPAAKSTAKPASAKPKANATGKTGSKTSAKSTAKKPVAKKPATNSTNKPSTKSTAKKPAAKSITKKVASKPVNKATAKTEEKKAPAKKSTTKSKAKSSVKKPTAKSKAKKPATTPKKNSKK